MAADHWSEDEAVGHAPALAARVGHQAHAPEVHLHLAAGLAVGETDRRAPSAEPELADREAVQRPVRHDDAAPCEQVVDLGEAQLLLEARLEERALALKALPALAAAGGPARADLADHRAEELVAELILVAALVQPRIDGRLHVAARRLAVDRQHPCDLAQAVLAKPEPQDLARLDHRYLPEHFPHLLLDRGAEYQSSEGPSGGP